MDSIGGLAEDGGFIDGLTDFASAALDAGLGLADAVVDTAGELAINALDFASGVANGVLNAAADVADALFGDTEDDVGGIVDSYMVGVDGMMS